MAVADKPTTVVPEETGDLLPVNPPPQQQPKLVESNDYVTPKETSTPENLKLPEIPPTSLNPWDADYKQKWETDADEMANYKLLEDTATVEASQLKSRQNIESNATSSAVDATMLKYQTNQTNDKMGWTGGGSSLDMKTQEMYLKASIQADLYGQLELQKYGYTVEMAKARAAFDANYKQLALEYMKEANTQAYNQYQISGIWISPDVKDRLASWDIAEETMKEFSEDPENPDYQRALKIKEEILKSFGSSENPLSENGVDVLRKILQKQNLYTENTLTMAQIRDLNVSTDNAEMLVNKETDKQNEAEGKYVYTDKDGKRQIVDFNKDNWDDIRKTIAQTPGLADKYIKTIYGDVIDSAYQKWLDENKKDHTPQNFENFKDTDFYNDQVTKAVEWAQKAKMPYILLGNQRISLAEKTTSSIVEKDGKFYDEENRETDKNGYLINSNGEYTFIPVGNLDIGSKNTGSTSLSDGDGNITNHSINTSLLNSGYITKSIDSDKDIFVSENNTPLTVDISGKKAFVDDLINKFKVKVNDMGTYEAMKGEQANLILAIYEDINTPGKIPNGSVIPINYGGVSSGGGYALFYLDGEVHVLNGDWADGGGFEEYKNAPNYRKLALTFKNIYIPSGFKMVDATGSGSNGKILTA